MEQVAITNAGVAVRVRVGQGVGSAVDDTVGALVGTRGRHTHTPCRDGREGTGEGGRLRSEAWYSYRKVRTQRRDIKKRSEEYSTRYGSRIKER